MYGNGNLPEEPSLISSTMGKDGWEVWSRRRASQCLRDGIARVEDRWTEEGRGAGTSLTYEEFAYYSGRIGGGTGLAQRGVPEALV